MEAEHSVETFYPDPALYEKAEELYLAILRAIEGAAEWLKQHPVGKLRSLLLLTFYD
jgi:ABC-type nitrate/sulfonate/bicarbonate transport system substrate-binding protein